MERQSTRPSLTSRSVSVIASNKHGLTTSVIFRFPRRYKLSSLQLVSVKALDKYFIPSSPNSLSLMSKLVNVKFLLVKASGKTFKSVSTRAPGSRATCHLTDFNETLPVLRVYPKTKKDKLVSVLVFSGGR